MSKVVDERVVEMRFDNSNFEKNTKQSLLTLNKLNESLKLKDASNGLKEVERTAKSFNLDPLTKSVQTVGASFSSLQVIGITALANITNSAVNAGKQIVSALTIDPVKTGFQEYETQIGAVQTILANTESKGTTLTDVNAALDELNTYADKTIYNFTQMTKNIGTFTAAGVDLEKSVTSIKGIANLAAISGSNAQQASTAMYQLSQALAAGRVSLMDWNSAMHAGMGGQVFQDALKRTANNMGKNVDALIEKYGSFRESLTQGEWLTADVLTETLTQLSGAYTKADLLAKGYTESQAQEIVELAQTAVDAATKVKTITQLWDTMKEAVQSGWSQTWEILVGDFEESKDFFTGLSDLFGNLINESAEARNSVLYDSMTSNWKKITDSITEAGISAEDFKDKVSEIGRSEMSNFDEVVKDAGSLEKAFKSGKISSILLFKALNDVVGSADDVKSQLKEIQGEYENTTDVIDALTEAGYTNAELADLRAKANKNEAFSIQELSDAQLTSLGYTEAQINQIRTLEKQLDLARGGLNDFIKNIDEKGGREYLIDALMTSLNSFVDISKSIGKAWNEVFPPATADQILEFSKRVNDFVTSLKPSEDTLNKISRVFKGLFSVLSIGINLVLPPLKTLGNKIRELSGGFLDGAASFGDYLYELNNSVKSGRGFKIIGDIASDALGAVAKAISFVADSFSGVRGLAYKTGSFVGTIIDTIVGGLNFLKNTIESFGNGFGGFKGIISNFGDFIGGFLEKAFDLLDGIFAWIGENIGITEIFAALAGGGIFTAAKKIGSFFDTLSKGFEKMQKPETSKKITEVLDGVKDSLTSFQKGVKTVSILAIAVSLGILASSLNKIAELDSVKVLYSVGMLKLLMMILNSGFNSLSKSLSTFKPKGLISAGLAMIALSASINILASAMQKMASLRAGEIAKGLFAIGVMMGELVGAMKLMGSGRVAIGTSIALLAVAAACKILASVMTELSSLSWEEIGRGLTAMGGSIGILSGAVIALSKMGGFKSLFGGAAILIASFSLYSIATNLEKLGSLSWEEIGRGLTAMGGALAELGLTVGLLGKLAGFSGILGAVSILIVAQSLEPISETLQSLGNMSWEQIGKGLAAMGGALLELGIVVGLLGALTGFSGLLGAVSILIVAQSLYAIAENLERFGSMSWDEIGRGLTAMGAALLELGIVVGLLGGLTGFAGILGAAAIFVVVQGLDELATALEMFGSMSWEEIGRGLTAMGGALGVLAGITGTLGTLAPLGSLLGSASLLAIISGLDDLANALAKFGSMSWDEIGRGLTAMGAAMGTSAIGGLLNTFSGFGAGSISKMAIPLGDLADSIKKWEDVKIPEGFGWNMAGLAAGIMEFNFSGWGASAIAEMAKPIGDLAISVKKWAGVTIPSGLTDRLGVLAEGVSKFTFSGFGAGALAKAAPGVGQMADSVSKWKDVNVPDDMEESLTGLANGVKAFSFAFMGGWSISALVGPLGDLVEPILKWKDVRIPSSLSEDLTSLADGIKGFSFAFTAGWSIDAIVGPLGELADSVIKWQGLSIAQLGTDMSSLADAISKFANISFISTAAGFESFTTVLSERLTEGMSLLLTVISENTEPVTAGFSTLIDNVIVALSLKNELFMTQGRIYGGAILSGLNSPELAETRMIAITTFVNVLANAIRLQYSPVYNAGVYMGTQFVIGFSDGITANTFMAVARAQAMARAAAEAAAAELAINSPSKVGYSIGNFFGLGFTNAIRDSGDTAYERSSEMADKARQGLNDAVAKISKILDSDMDVKPTITPILDLSNVRTGANKLNAMFSRNRALSIGSIGTNKSISENQNGASKEVSSPVWNFTQNNYSPKALSRVEIYRQTKNQISAAKGLVTRR